MNIKHEPEGDISLSEDSPHEPSGETELSQSDESDLLSPLPLPVKQEISMPRPTSIHGLSAKLEQEEDDNCALSDHMDDYFAMQEGSMLAVNSKMTSQQFYSGFGGQHDGDGLDRDTDSSPLTDNSEPRSPDGIDIATRRNRRPAPLSIAGGRSLSYTARATDSSRRSDQAASMRRISSSTGSGRVKKSVATPRSPFFDRNADGILQRRPSPNAAGRQGSAAPPTPDTPVALQQQGAAVDAAMSSLYSLDSKFTPPDLVISDPTLRTPPTTPGFADSLFHLGAGYEMGISEENIITPGISRTVGGVEMTGNSAAFANYMMNNSQCSGQQMAPMFQTQMGQSYFGFVGANSNSEYSWSDLSPSTASTSSSSQQRYMTLGSH